jgi:hypothetical protein
MSGRTIGMVVIFLASRVFPSVVILEPLIVKPMPDNPQGKTDPIGERL